MSNFPFFLNLHLTQSPLSIKGIWDSRRWRKAANKSNSQSLKSQWNITSQLRLPLNLPHQYRLHWILLIVGVRLQNWESHFELIGRKYLIWEALFFLGIKAIIIEEFVKLPILVKLLKEYQHISLHYPSTVMEESHGKLIWSYGFVPLKIPNKL